jgi:hypothetical protein
MKRVVFFAAIAGLAGFAAAGAVAQTVAGTAAQTVAGTMPLTVHDYNDSLVLSNSRVTVVVHAATGMVDYRLAGGILLENTVGYINDLHYGRVSTADLSVHAFSIDSVADSLGRGIRINFRHLDNQRPLYLQQRITVYEGSGYVLVGLEAEVDGREGPGGAGTPGGRATFPETRDISPLAVLPSRQGRVFLPGGEPRILDVPFDNDDWVGVVERHWGGGGPGTDAAGRAAGISYELAAVYDNSGLSGMVLGSVQHDFWKTGIAYRTGVAKGVIDSFVVYGGAATPDNPALPPAYGGLDGTHDHTEHATMTGPAVHSPVIYLGGGGDVRETFKDYGTVNARINGRRYWKGNAPFYWNSFAVEGVLGYEKVMMPPGVGKISDFIASLHHFNDYAPPVLSIDSYDQSIYTTELLASLGRYGGKHHQQLGFYFTPFTVWTWKSGMDQAMVPGTDYTLKEVILKDPDGHPVAYKDGDWGAFPLDPTHPATRQFLISQLQKAKAIGARFVKIDFLTGGALEATRHYDPAIRSGMQAYNYGMTLLRHLMDSILGPDIFVTQAISPMFPSQYAHARFNSTDVYSQLRDDEKGFPHWGGTEASLATGSHLGWVQGTILPYVNLDVTVMQRFEKNPELSEQEVKVRLYALMVMGSILGDGSDYRQPLAAQRARQFLDNPAVCRYFSHPQAFTPLRWADGDSEDQQLAFYLAAGAPGTAGAAGAPGAGGQAAAGNPALTAVFNFSNSQGYQQDFTLAALGLPPGKYTIRDFMTDQVVGTIADGQAVFTLRVAARDAQLVKVEK